VGDAGVAGEGDDDFYGEIIIKELRKMDGA
jgi:hypothetical protein